MPANPFPTKREILDELDRELKLRAGVYPKQVRDRRVTQTQADQQLDRLRAARSAIAYLDSDQLERMLWEMDAAAQTPSLF